MTLAPFLASVSAWLVREIELRPTWKDLRHSCDTVGVTAGLVAQLHERFHSMRAPLTLIPIMCALLMVPCGLAQKTPQEAKTGFSSNFRTRPSVPLSSKNGMLDGCNGQKSRRALRLSWRQACANELIST